MRKALYILGQLSDDDIEWLLKAGGRRWIAPGSVLIHEGQAVESLYIVLEGYLSVTYAAVGQEVARLGAGEIIGEMSFVDARPPSATVTALEPALVFTIDRAALAAQLEHDLAFAVRFYRAIAIFLSSRIRQTVSRLGYGDLQPTAAAIDDSDELDETVLDNVHLAGARFDRMLQRLRGQ